MNTKAATKKAPPSREGRRATTGASGSGTGAINYTAALSANGGDFTVTVTASPSVIGDDDWVGIYANQGDVNQDIQSVNAGGSGVSEEDYPARTRPSRGARKTTQG